MLSPANAELVGRDTTLPGLSTVLDPERFLAALTASAPGINSQSAKLRYLRYKPGQNCLAAYTLDVEGTPVECYAKAFRTGDLGKLAKANLRVSKAAGLGSGRFVWPAFWTEVCIFPHDSKVKSLRFLANAEDRETFLRRRLREYPAMWSATIRQLAYKPERRWVGSLEIAGHPKAVCRLYGDNGLIDRRSRQTLISPGEVLRVPQLLARADWRNLLFLDWRPGHRLNEALLDVRFDPAVVARLGIALSELHRQQVPGLPLASREEDAASLVKVGRLLASILPSTAQRVESIARTLAQRLIELPQQQCTIHGDLDGKQVLFDGETVTLLDLDEVCRGDALSDLATFVAYLETRVICRKLTTARLDSTQHALLEGILLRFRPPPLIAAQNDHRG